MEEELRAKWPSPVVALSQQEVAQTRTPKLGLGAELQIIKSTLGTKNAVFPGLCAVIRF